MKYVAKVFLQTFINLYVLINRPKQIKMSDINEKIMNHYQISNVYAGIIYQAKNIIAYKVGNISQSDKYFGSK